MEMSLSEKIIEAKKLFNSLEAQYTKLVENHAYHHRHLRYDSSSCCGNRESHEMMGDNYHSHAHKCANLFYAIKDKSVEIACAEDKLKELLELLQTKHSEETRLTEQTKKT